MAIEYRFKEDKLIAEFVKYIDSTYDGHYGQGGLQSSEIIVDRGHGQGFFHGNIDKYNGRYGKKGDSPAEWRKDIIKIIHYGFLALYEHDRITAEEVQEKIDTDTFGVKSQAVDHQNPQGYLGSYVCDLSLNCKGTQLSRFFLL